MIVEERGVARPAPAPSTAESIAPWRGIALMMAGCVVMTTNDAVMKWLTGSYPTGEIIFLRGMVALLPVIVIARFTGGLATLRVHDWRWQAVRGLCVLASTFFFISGLRALPLADVIATGFTGPLFLTAMAPLFLGERVGWRRWSAVIVGFVGMLVIVRPTREALSWVVLWPIAASFAGSVRDIITRRLSVRETSNATLFSTIVVVNVVALASLPMGWPMPSAADAGLIVFAGLLMGVGQYMVIEALRLAEAALIAPFRYSSLLWGTALGYIGWGTVPDMWVGVGAVLVVASGIYIVQREAALRRQGQLAPAPQPAP